MCSAIYICVQTRYQGELKYDGEEFPLDKNWCEWFVLVLEAFTRI